MAKGKAATPDTIVVMLGNPIRTSAGDPPPDRVVELPAGEARDLIRSGLAVRVS